MRKTLPLLVTLLFTTLMFSVEATAQCGSGCDISINLQNSFSVPSTSGASYFWSATGSVQITSSNTSNSITTDGGSGTLYVTTYKAGAAPCCNSYEVSAPTPCSISISSVNEVNALGSDEVAFYTVPTLGSGTSITSSVFEVTYESATTQIYLGTLNSNGYPQIQIPVSCDDRVTRVDVTVNASSSGNTCSDTAYTNFIGVCGTGDYFSTSFNREVYSIGTNGKAELVTSFSKGVKADFSLLNSGIYLLKVKDGKKLLFTRKVMVQ